MATIAARSLNSPVASLSKVKPADARRLSKLGIETIRDLLMTLPFDWEIYGAPRRIADLGDGESSNPSDLPFVGVRRGGRQFN